MVRPLDPAVVPLVSAFKKAWEEADKDPDNAGHRTEAGITAVLSLISEAVTRVDPVAGANSGSHTSVERSRAVPDLPENVSQ